MLSKWEGSRISLGTVEDEEIDAGMGCNNYNHYNTR